MQLKLLPPSWRGSSFKSWIARWIGNESGDDESSRRASYSPHAPSTPSPGQYVFSEHDARLAAVGDIHGRIDLLEDIGRRLDTMAVDASKRLVEIYLGDYVDHGGNPSAVLDFLSKRKTLADRDVICLRGNHEQLLLDALENNTNFVRWVEFGGHATLASYGISPAGARSNTDAKRTALLSAMPARHLTFLRDLPISYRRGEFFFVHAGVRPKVPLEEQSTDDLLWIRDDFLKSNAAFGAVVVHGHTPVPQPQFLSNRIAIDTGAHFSGHLTCLIVDSERVALMPTRSTST